MSEQAFSPHHAALSSLSDDDLRGAYAYPPALDRPYVRACFIQSLDGSTSLDGRSGGLGDDDDQRVLAILRQLADVVLVGAGTVRAEGYGELGLTREAERWRVDAGMSAHPRLAIVSASLQLDPTASVFTDAPVRPLVLTGRMAPPDRADLLAAVADVVACGTTRAEPTGIVQALANRALLRIACEGGPTLMGELIRHRAVDELCLTLSPLLVGGDGSRISGAGAGAETPTRTRLAHVFSADRMLFTRWVREAEPA